MDFIGLAICFIDVFGRLGSDLEEAKEGRG
jgi:hypothetical protein